VAESAKLWVLRLWRFKLPLVVQLQPAIWISWLVAKAEFRRLVVLGRTSPSTVWDVVLRAASEDFVAQAENCYQELHGAVTGRSTTGSV